MPRYLKSVQYDLPHWSYRGYEDEATHRITPAAIHLSEAEVGPLTDRTHEIWGPTLLRLEAPPTSSKCSGEAWPSAASAALDKSPVEKKSMI
ncbi:hypothetical protein NMY22_g8009 [Coprinellus aureogranulatus]|nr:hypothetical protein NMY22_g8009 [Coprinellus aureogranulatus]